MTTDNLNKLASSGAELPAGLTSSEQLLYLSLRMLYANHKTGIATTEQAKIEKRKLLEMYELNAANEKLFERHVRIRNQYSQVFAEANKSDCEICNKLAKIFDGRED